MEYTSGFNEKNGICIVRVKGKLKRPDDSFELQHFSRNFGKSHGCNHFLFDMTKAQIISEPTDGVLIGMVPVDKDASQRNYRVALVYADNITEHKLIQTIAVARGYNVRVFTHESHALEWLTSKN
ncbi:hypothetical protein [Kaarinaea lacus]